MALPPLRQLLAVVKALLIASGRLAMGTWIRLLRKVAWLWSILRSTVRTGTTRKPYDPKKPGQPTTSDPYDASEKPTDTTNTTHEPTLTRNEDTIPLDSRMSCSLHPYPYLNTNVSRASLSDGLRIARSAHRSAVSSRNASRSNQSFVSSPQAQSFQEGYTFTVKTPDHPLSPTGARRQWSLSSPQLGGSGSASRPDSGFPGFDADVNSLDKAPSMLRRTPSSTPEYSTRALPAGDVLSVCGSIHQVNLGHERIFPIIPEYFQRYDRSAFAKEQDTEFTVKALTMDFRQYPDPPGWKPILHPEGVLYFYNEDKKAVTEANLYKKMYYNQIAEDLRTLDEHVQSNHIRLPENYTLAMDLNVQSDGVIYTDYYYADHDKKIIFFLDDIEASTNILVWKQVKGVYSLAHIRHEFEAQYWSHGMLYPATMKLTEEHVAELRDTILHYIGDATTSQYSTSPYVTADLDKMLSQLNAVKKNVGTNHTQGSTNLLCRMMLIFTRQKFYNWHGLPEARIYRDQSVHGKNRRHKTLLIKILSPLLFSAPDVHLKTLEKMWVDGIMHQAVWLESIKKLNEEWQEFILYATVLLNANVAFLAIQSIDIDRNPYRTPVQVACYLSIVSSIGSIILGLLLLRQNRTRAHGTTDDVLTFLRARSHPTLGLETLAILYSLPYALLLWGMVSFLAAFAGNCFSDSNVGTRLILGAAWVAFAVLVVWCIWMGWVKYEHNDVPPESSAADENTLEGDVKSSSPEPSEKQDSTRPGTESRLSRVASRPHSMLGPHAHAAPVHTRPGSRMSDLSRVSGAPIHVPMPPVKEASRDSSGLHEEAGAPLKAGVLGPMRMLWSRPARLSGLLFGETRNSGDSQRTVFELRQPVDV